jgi:hypothetical protein
MHTLRRCPAVLAPGLSLAHSSPFSLAHRFASPATPYDGLGEFRGGAKKLKVRKEEPWDGKDGEVEEEEFSLEDLMGDDEF